MDPVTIGFIASTAISVGSKIFGGMAAGKAAEKAAKEKAVMTAMQRREQIRQRTMASDRRLGEARATAYASNIQVDKSSAGRYINAMDMENMREISYAKYAAKKEVEAIREGGKGAGDSLFISALGEAASSAASLFAAGYTPKTTNPLSTTGDGGATLGGINTSGWQT